MSLTERRKADRMKMADYCYSNWIAAPGFIATREDGWPCGSQPFCIMLHLEAPRGVRLSLDFDGKSSQPDIFVLSWNIASGSDARFVWDFAGCRNGYHKRKATDVVVGWDALKDILGERISQLQRGEAFEP